MHGTTETVLLNIKIGLFYESDRAFAYPQNFFPGILLSRVGVQKLHQQSVCFLMHFFT